MMRKGRNKCVPLNGEKNPMAKLTNEAAQSIRDLVLNGLKQIDASRKFNVSPMTISRIIRKESWK